MSQPSQQPNLDVRGAVDLSAFGRPSAPPPGVPGGAPAAGGYVVDVTEETFARIVENSAQYPVVMLLWLPTDQANAQLAIDLGVIAEELAGRILLGRVDVEAYPQIAAAFQVQGVPTVVAILQGQPVPLFQGTASGEQIRAVLEQVLEASVANGVTGRAPSQSGDAAPQEAPAEAPEPELPPLHQEAYDAIERDDLDGALAAYEKAIKQDPRDDLAVAGLAQVGLLRRTRDLVLQTARDAAAANPDDLPAQLDVADLDLLGGKVEDALGRLLERVASAGPEDKETLRLRLVDYFQVLGPQDPRVGPARRALTNALY